MKKLTSVINIVLTAVVGAAKIKEVEKLEQQLVTAEAVHEKFVQHARAKYSEVIGTDESLEALVNLNRTQIKKLDELLAIAIDIKNTSDQTRILKDNIINDIRIKAYETERRLHQMELDDNLKRLNERLSLEIVMAVTTKITQIIKG